MIDRPAVVAPVSPAGFLPDWSEHIRMTPGPQVVLFDAAPARSQTICKRLREKGLRYERVELAPATADKQLHDADVAAVVLDHQDGAAPSSAALALIGRLAESNLATLVWGLSEQHRPPNSGLLDCVSADVSLDEVVGRLTTLAHYAPLLKRLERELRHLHRLGHQLNRYFSEIDQEMRLAGRLQRDFLPRTWPQVPPLIFASLYRPASWVSGDMYDIFRLDERHVGIFVADAMGHGVAAGLLTMFLRQALVAKQADGSTYRITKPAQAMASLHECLVRQKLPNCQFVTACYGIIDSTRLEMCFSRCGHPYPLHITPAGTIAELQVPGALLGLPGMEPEFSEARLQLNPGDKVIFFSDGVERAFIAERGGPDQTLFTDNLRKWATLGAQAFVDALGEYLDGQEGSLHPADDVTVAVVEAAR